MIDQTMNRTEESKLYKVLKVNLRDCCIKESKDKTGVNEDKNYFFIDIDLDNKYKLKRMYTLVKESEIIRIMRSLNLENNNTPDYGFVVINDLITVDISTTKYRKNQSGIIYIRKFKKDEYGKKKVVELSKYKRLLASTGGIRSEHITFIKDKFFNQVNEILLCGMPKDMEYEFFSKFSAYYALASTDSTPVTMPRIVVVKDYEFDIEETFDIVTETVQENKSINYDVYTDTFSQNTKPFDGAGLVSVECAKKWMKDLKLDYLPSSFQFRAIPGIKGNLYPVDLQAFAKKYSDVKTISDAWGNDIGLYDQDGNFAIDVILTQSQFKFIKKYDDFESWYNAFKKETHGYSRTFNIAKVGDKYGNLKEKTLLSYQPLQSLNLNDEQIKALCEDTVDTIKDISTNVDSFLKYRGLELDEVQIPEYYKALSVNKELFYDPWMQEKIKKDIEGFKEKTYRGVIFVQGNYQTLIPEIYGLALFAFGQEPVGLLQKDEVYSNYWCNKGVTSLDVIRFPHVAMEHGLVNVVDPKQEGNEDMEFYKYITTGIITSMYSTLPLKLNSADFDGDKILTNCSDVLKKAVSEQKANTITFVSNKRDAAPKSKIIHKINEMPELISTDLKGMSNNIGAVINKISILWSMPQNEQRDKYIKIMSVIGSLTIDYVKTGQKTPIPKEILDYLKDKKLPEFMRTRYKYKDKKEKNANKNRKILGEETKELFNQYDCTMNRINKHMREQVGSISLEKESPDFDFLSLMMDKEIFKYNATYPKIIKLLTEMKTESDNIASLKVLDENGDCDTEKAKERDYQYLSFYEYCRIELLQLCTVKNKMDKNKLIDCLIYAFFIDKDFALKNPDKSILWNCFGKELTKRFKGKTRKTNFYSDDKIVKLADKAKEIQKTIDKNKKARMRKNKELAKIDMLKGNQNVIIYKDEILYLRKMLVNSNEFRLALGLLILDRFCKAYNRDFNIYISKRNVINQTQIAVLTGIDPRKYNKLTNLLIEKGIVSISPKPKTEDSVLKCEMKPIPSDETEPIILKDINDFNKIIKNVNNLNKITEKIKLPSNF